MTPHGPHNRKKLTFLHPFWFYSEFVLNVNDLEKSTVWHAVHLFTVESFMTYEKSPEILMQNGVGGVMWNQLYTQMAL